MSMSIDPKGRGLAQIEPSMDAVADLSGPARLLAAYPGVVIIFDGSGEPDEANASGRDFINALRADRTTLADLYRATRAVRESGGAHREDVQIALGDGMAWVDLLIIPTPEGRILALGRDATFETNVRAALVESRQRYKNLVDIVSDFAWETDADGAFAFVSLGGALGYSADRLVGIRARDLVVEPSNTADSIPFETSKLILHSEVWLKDSEGRPACLLSTATPLFDEKGRWKGARGLSRDVTRERLRDFDSAQSQARDLVVAYLVDQIRSDSRPQAMLETAVGAMARALSADTATIFLPDGADSFELVASFGKQAGATAAEGVLQGLAPEALGYEGRIHGQQLLLHKIRHRDAFSGAIAVSRSGDDRSWDPDDRSLITAIEAQIGPILAQVAERRRAERLSRTDALTGLLNRGAFLAEIEPQIARAQRHGSHGALLYVDLDNFKPVNDLSGHHVGDKVLREVGRMLASHSRPYDLVARLGGDEFALWLDDIDEASAMAVAQRLVSDCEALRRYSPRGAAPVGLSVGVAIFDADSGESALRLIDRADKAMYEAKRAGKARCVVASGGRARSDAAPEKAAAE